MLEQVVWDLQAGGSERGHRLFEIHRVPVHDGSHDEIQATGAQSLIIERPIVDHAAAVEAHRTTEGVLRLTLVQADSDAAPELGTLQLFEHEQGEVDAAKFAQAPRQSILTWLRSQLAQHQRGGNCALPN
jgi:hypothetical protein